MQTDNVFTRKEYIEREAVNKLLKDACDECRDACEEFDGIYADCNQCIMHGVVKGLQKIPAADVAPVVRCGECAYCEWKNEVCTYGWCKQNCTFKMRHEYCSDGARMDGDGI